MRSPKRFNHRKLIFEGNSLTDLGQDGGPVYGQYVPLTIYNNVKASHTLVYSCYAISGRTQTQINASLSTNITPYIRPGDIIINWEGTNDLFVNALSANDAYANLVTYANTVRNLGAKLIIGTVIARDYVSDPGDLMDRIDAYNVLVRTNASSICEAVCDLGADAMFDTRADTANGTNYKADKVHLATAGQNNVISLMTTTLNTIL